METVAGLPEGNAKADAEFVLAKAVVLHIHGPGTGGGAAGGVGEAVADVELDARGKVHGGARHQGVGETEIVLAFEAGARAARPGAGGIAPVEIGRAQPRADIGREAGERAEIGIAVHHEADGGIIGLEGAGSAGAGRPALEIVPGEVGRQVRAHDIAELVAEARAEGDGMRESPLVEIRRYAGLRHARPPGLGPAGIAEVAANVPALRRRAPGHVDLRRVDDVEIGCRGNRRHEAGEGGNAKRYDTAAHLFVPCGPDNPAVAHGHGRPQDGRLYPWLTIFLKE